MVNGWPVLLLAWLIISNLQLQIVELRILNPLILLYFLLGQKVNKNPTTKNNSPFSVAQSALHWLENEQFALFVDDSRTLYCKHLNIWILRFRPLWIEAGFIPSVLINSFFLLGDKRKQNPLSWKAFCNTHAFVFIKFLLLLGSFSPEHIAFLLEK